MTYLITPHLIESSPYEIYIMISRKTILIDIFAALGNTSQESIVLAKIKYQESRSV